MASSSILSTRETGTRPIWRRSRSGPSKRLRLNAAPRSCACICGAGEVDHLTPSSRADVATGTQETNEYRAFYGQRFKPGEALQVAAQQFTNIGPLGGGGDETSLMARLGYARGPWSFEVYGNRYRRGMDPLSEVDLNGGPPPGPGLGDFEGTWTTAYIRGGYGDPDHGVWAQVMASTLQFKNSSLESSVATDTIINPATGLPFAQPNADTSTSESQYIASGGFSKWGIRFSGTDRVRVFAGHGTRASNEPSGRASFESGPLALSAYVDHDAPSAWPTSTASNAFQTIPITMEEVSARLTPLPFISIMGAASRTTSTGAPDAPPTSLAMRGEVGVRVGQLWFSGGVMTQDTARVAALAVYESELCARGDRPHDGRVRIHPWCDLGKGSTPTSRVSTGARPVRIARTIRHAPSCRCSRSGCTSSRDARSRSMHPVCWSIGRRRRFPSPVAAKCSRQCRTRSRHCSSCASSKPPSSGISATCWAMTTRSCRASSCRGRSTSTASVGHSGIEPRQCLELTRLLWRHNLGPCPSSEA